MNRFMSKIKKSFTYELPIIRLYALLYLIGVFIGAGAAVLLKNDFSAQAQLLFNPENAGDFFSSLLQQLVFFLLLFFLGLTVIGMPLMPLYPLYKGFSIGLLIALSVILSGVRGLIFGTLAFFAQNIYYTVLGYFICYSSTRLSISLFSLLRGRGKHGVSYREFREHIFCFLMIIPFLLLGALWESKVVPLILNLI
ncbi:MAG: stage II sporulation protein M [Clostridia bacterium]|nr:stage II sporulation protein M [Clostridia bacterium]